MDLNIINYQLRNLIKQISVFLEKYISTFIVESK